MEDKPIIITIDNYNNKKITFTIPSDAKVEIFRMTTLNDIFSSEIYGEFTYNNIQIEVNHDRITMEVTEKEGENN